jgi:hypothetical protein
MPIRSSLCLALATTLLVPSLALAIEPPQDLPSVLFVKQFSSPELEVQPSVQIFDRGSDKAGTLPSLQRFYAYHSDEWEVRWDQRSDRPNLIQGAGIPFLPGRGNKLRRDDLKVGHGGELRMADVEGLVRQFLADFPEVLNVSGFDLRLDPNASVSVGDGVGDEHQLWFLELQQYHHGIPVVGAKAFFRINNGNLIQLGTERVAPVRIPTAPKVSREAAFAKVLQAGGFKVSEITEILDPGTLEIVPALTVGEQPAESYKGLAGQGYRHYLVWQLSFRRADDSITYQALVNARTGKVMQVVDVTSYAAAQVTGGVYPNTNSDAEVVRGLPFTNVTNSTTKVTDVGGAYDYAGGTATATLNGKYIKITDACGSISLSNSSTGNIAFGTSGGTDCTTPGIGGTGNTHAARSAYYHLTNINRKAASFFPTNTWLAGTTTANVNVNNTCNANWNGTSMNFYRSGGGCSNSGEIAAVFLHEWGHGMDQNTGGAASDKGTGEAVGDTFAFLETKDSCIGPNFQPGVPCFNCGTCTGVRDMAPFSLGGTKTIAKPSTVTDNNGINCDRWSCPYNVLFIIAYQGPMGYEGHCESTIASSANWDLAQSLIAHYGTTAGWAAMDAIWYKSLTPSKSAYQVASGGKCNTAAVVNGCGSSNWYTVFLAADDNDGNLTNGTPNGCRIWDAFNAHGIACGTRPACTA